MGINVLSLHKKNKIIINVPIFSVPFFPVYEDDTEDNKLYKPEL